MRYLVTGAAGFVGAHLVRRLLDKGAAYVYATDRVDLPLNHSRLRFIKADIQQGLPEIEADVLIHLVGSPGVWFAEKMPRDDYEMNVLSLDPAFRCVKKGGLTKAVLASSWQVYGENERREVVPGAPNNVYGRHKYEAEERFKNWCDELGAAYTVLRMSWVYGPGMRKNLVYDIFKGEVYIGMDSCLDFVYIDDVCEAFIMASEREEWENRVINISSGKGTTLLYISNVFKNMGLSKDIKVISNIRKDVVVNNELAVGLGWIPKTSIEEGLRRTYGDL